MDVPEDLLYTEEHEWARVEADGVRVGITEYAQHQLGDVVYVELPKVGARLEIMKPFGVVESVKAASDLYAPMTGEVLATNERLVDEPELVNTDPYGDGWMIVVKPADQGQLEALLDAGTYADMIGGDEA